MPEFTLVLPEGEVLLDPNISYEVYGQFMSAKEVSKLKLSHLPWLDQITLLQEVEYFRKISILYHPDLVADIYENESASKYWGKTEHEALVIFKRIKINVASDNEEERKLAQPLTKRRIDTTRARTVDALEKKGYSREPAYKLLDQFLEAKGKKYLNFPASKICKLVDEFALTQGD